MGHGQGQDQGSDSGEAAAPFDAPRSALTPSAPFMVGDGGAEDARLCQRMAARNARTFFMASRLLPDRKRRAAFAVYATCRTADDIVDAGLTLGRVFSFQPLEHASHAIVQHHGRSVCPQALPGRGPIEGS